MKKTGVRVLLAVSILFALLLSIPAWAASDSELMTLNGFPNKPIEIVTHSGVGGGGDMMGRAIIAAAQRFVPQPLVMVNANGATANNMGAYLAEGKTDGHTVVLGQLSNIAWNITGQQTWYLYDYLIPVVNMQEDPSCIVVPASSKYQTMEEYIEAYKAGEVHMAGPAVGGQSWLFTAKLSKLTGAEMNYIPYSDGGEITTALIGGHIDGTYTQLSEVAEPVKGGLLRILAFVTEKRLGGEFSDIPTVTECGIAFTYPSWRGFFLRAGTPPEYVKYWAEVLKKAHDEPSFQKYLADSYSVSAFMGPEEFKEAILKDETTMVNVLKENAPELLRKDYKEPVGFP